MTVIRRSRQSWEFSPPATLLSGGAICGPREGQGPLAADMDRVCDDLRLGQSSFEQAEQLLQQWAAEAALAKAGLTRDDMDLLLAGDLLNQITPSCFTARWSGAPFLGQFSACATIAQALSLAALAVCAGAAAHAMALASSHTCTAERQFRYPNEYGSQKPPYSQQTATVAGAAIVSQSDPPGPARISGATLGRIIDQQVTDPFQLSSAMAPAFADTVAVHLRDFQRQVDDYDLILSGDLGRDGCVLGRELLARQGVTLSPERHLDCGRLLFAGDERTMAGGSGCGCAAAVGFGHILRRLQEGELKRVLLVATGALLSPVANQQKETIPGVAHAVVLEGGAYHA